MAENQKEKPTPGHVVEEKLEEFGWSQIDLARVMGKDKGFVSRFIQGKTGVSVNTAALLGEAFGTGSEYWLELQASSDAMPIARSDVSRRAEMYKKYPVREMMKRGWIKQTLDTAELEAELAIFFSRPQFPFAARRSNESSKEFLQKAWLYRTYNLAKHLIASPYSETKLAKAMHELKSLLMAPEEIVQIPRILSEAGVRFLIVEALPSSKIDGVCFWLNDKNPVVALSTRHDRIDNFWFTLTHELQHVKYRHGRDSAMLDIDIMECDANLSDEERLADEGAADFLVPTEEIEGFIARVAPLFTPMRVKGFSKRIGVHSGIVVGQLQRRGAIEYNQLRKSLVKIRNIVTTTTPHDGWGMVAQGE